MGSPAVCLVFLLYLSVLAVGGAVGEDETFIGRTFTVFVPSPKPKVATGLFDVCVVNMDVDNITVDFYSSLRYVELLNSTKIAPNHTANFSIPNTKKCFGLLTSGDAAVYVMPRGRGDPISIFPDASLGTEYLGMTVCDIVDSVCHIDIVSPAEGTVYIHFPDNMQQAVTMDRVTYQAGESVVRTLEAGEHLELESPADFTGVYINASAPIAVIGGAAETRWPGLDASQPLAEMLPPLTAWGKEVFIPEDNVIIRILASSPLTMVKIGHSNSFWMESGQWTQRNLSGSERGTTLVATKPVLVGAVIGQEGRPPQFFILCPVEQFINRTVIPRTSSGGSWSLTVITFATHDLLLHQSRQYINLLPDQFAWTAGDDSRLGTHRWNLMDTPYVLETHKVNAPFFAYVQTDSGYVFQVGSGLSVINQPCTPTVSQPGDYTDNDCDGLIDEDANPGADEAQVPTGGYGFVGRRFQVVNDFHCDSVDLIFTSYTTNAMITVNPPTHRHYLAANSGCKMNSSGSVPLVTATTSGIVSLSAVCLRNGSLTAIQVLPVEMYGIEYMISADCSPDCDVYVVAAFLQTTVRLTLRNSDASNVSYNGTAKSSGHVEITTLDQSQWLKITSSTGLAGTYVASDKPVAVYIWEAPRLGTPRWMQMFPITALGNVYATAASSDDGNFIEIFAVKPNTRVDVVNSTGTTSFVLGSTGSFHKYSLAASELVMVWALKAVAVVQLSDAPTAAFMLPKVTSFPNFHVLRLESSTGNQTTLTLLSSANCAVNVTSDGKLIQGNYSQTLASGTLTINLITWRIGHEIVIESEELMCELWGFVTVYFDHADFPMYGLPLDFNASFFHSRCGLTPDESPWDGQDNDCDGREGEESCPTGHFSDDDGDWMYNEDCGVTPGGAINNSAVVESAFTDLQPVSILGSTEIFPLSMTTVEESFMTNSTATSMTVFADPTVHVDTISATSVFAMPSSDVTESIEPTSVTSEALEDITTCSCGCKQYASVPLEEAVERATELQKELAVDRSKVAAKIRTKVSVPDRRVSAQVGGWLGVGLLTTVFTCIVILDAAALFRDLVSFCRQLKRCVTRE